MLNKNYIFLICARYYKSGLTLLLNLTVKCVLIMFLPCVVFRSRSKGVRGGYVAMTNIWIRTHRRVSSCMHF